MLIDDDAKQCTGGRPHGARHEQDGHASLGVENEQLRAQIAELKAMNRSRRSGVPPLRQVFRLSRGAVAATASGVSRVSGVLGCYGAAPCAASVSLCLVG